MRARPDSATSAAPAGAVRAPGWQHFPHMADVGVRGIGRSPGEAFANAALAMTAVIVPPDQVAPARPVAVTCTGGDLELLLADWLNALVYEMATRRMLFGRFDVHIDPAGLRATAWGESVDRVRHAPAVEIKGATLTELAVREVEPGLWLAQCVVDI